MMKIRFGVLIVSDSCAKGEALDTSGMKLISMIQSKVVENGEVIVAEIVPDDKLQIECKLKDWCDNEKVEVILTTGGTGIAKTDVTPEATAPLLDKEIRGISNLIFKHSSEITPLAALSRGIAGVRGKTLIVNLPGSEKASKECLESIAEILPHAVDLICDRKSEVKAMHAVLEDRKSKIGSFKVADRPRKSLYPCVNVSEAQEIVTTRIYMLKKEKKIDWKDSLGFVLAEEVFARDFLPPFDVSLKDGYAVLSSDITIKSYKYVVEAGDENLKKGHCVRVNTGGPIPIGADAVVQVEDTLLVGKSDCGSEETKIQFLDSVPKGRDIRPKGSDFKTGELLLRAGTYLDSPALGVLAAAGISTVKVFCKPVVGVFSTGNELVSPEVKLPPGKIRDSNRIMLLSLLKEEGFSGLDLGVVPDDPDALCNALDKGFRASDVLVTTGSMSMGDKDFMKEILKNDFEAEICFGRVLMKPGKPTAFAIINFEGKFKLWFGLPGNPASANVTAHLFLLPALRKISGWKNVFLPKYRVILDENINREDRPQYCRANLTYDVDKKCWKATTTGKQNSSSIASCVNANGFVVIPSYNERILENGYEGLLLRKYY